MAGTKDCGQHTAMSWPCVGEAGKTGEWRTSRPVLIPDKCIAVQRNKALCMQCWAFCPDSVISKTVPPEIDLLYCKGCGICAAVCPTQAIDMIAETDEGQETVQEDTCCGC
ncbi:MAG: 4Fe-4S binding protein [Candidatus Hydrogenedentes bacterium]|jgi:pyruvate ferredoxin oxidoreductase delta subunit|nr:4Fe-4S binding protein [Candidatus Hydrogenedentota bacterium]